MWAYVPASACRPASVIANQVTVIGRPPECMVPGVAVARPSSTRRPKVSTGHTDRSFHDDNRERPRRRETDTLPWTGTRTAPTLSAGLVFSARSQMASFAPPERATVPTRNEWCFHASPPPSSRGPRVTLPVARPWSNDTTIISRHAGRAIGGRERGQRCRSMSRASD
jgi:hypothetical protein